jgi:Thiamine pyrophosphate enzyme, N-terminal TPP binding domain
MTAAVLAAKEAKTMSSSSQRMKIGDFLLRRLKEAGVRHLFGVPGDYNLELLQQLQDAGAPQWIGTCSELNASYAADGYARLNGLGALLVTNGVGALSAINGVGGSYGDQSRSSASPDRYRSSPSNAAWGCTTPWPTGAMTISSTPTRT